MTYDERLAVYNFQTGYLIFEKHIESLFQEKNTPLRLGIACSGGPDSLLVLHYIAKYKNEHPEKVLHLMIIHIIDGHYIVEPLLKETMQEAYELVQKESDFYGIPLIIKDNRDTSIFYEKKSIETTCHELRKRYFQEIQKMHNLNSILTGHTKTDQLEHFFISIIRRTTLKRISGMDMYTPSYTRPLLFMNKNNTTKILQEINKQYVDDPCNTNMDYLRNKLRNNLLPILDTLDNRFSTSIITIMAELKEQQFFVEKTIQKIIENIDIESISDFLAQEKRIQYAIIEKKLHLNKIKSSFSITFYEEIIRFISQKKSKKHKIKNFIIIKDKNKWRIK